VISATRTNFNTWWDAGEQNFAEIYIPIETIPSVNFSSYKKFVVVGVMADCWLRLQRKGREEDRGLRIADCG
jgi:hypothetical protein